MPFESRAFALAKDTEQPQQYEDSYALDPRRGIAVVADGVSSAIFSRAWAAILTEAVVADPPDVLNPEAFAAWMQQRRQTWSGQIDVAGLAWFQKAKMASGAFSTLLWVQLSVPEQEVEGAFGAIRLQCFAIGDSCLFHIRDGQLVRSFPIQHSSELQADPLVLGSLDLNHDHLMQFVSMDEYCYADDLLVLCTDAVADWVLRTYESEAAIDWDHYWQLSPEQWASEIIQLRDQQAMRYDDATMVILQVGKEAAKEEEGAEPGDHQRTEKKEQPPVAGKSIRVLPQAVDISKTGEARAMPATDSGSTDSPNSASQQISEKVDHASDKMLKGLRKLKDKTIEKYNKKFGPKDK